MLQRNNGGAEKRQFEQNKNIQAANEFSPLKSSAVSKPEHRWVLITPLRSLNKSWSVKYSRFTLTPVDRPRKYTSGIAVTCSTAYPNRTTPGRNMLATSALRD